MSMNLHLKIDGEDIPLEQTKTKETSFVLGVDVEKCTDGQGYSTGFELSSIKNPDSFNEAYERLKELAFTKSVERGSIDNLLIEGTIRIKDSLNYLGYEGNIPVRSEAVLYFL